MKILIPVPVRGDGSPCRKCKTPLVEHDVAIQTPCVSKKDGKDVYGSTLICQPCFGVMAQEKIQQASAALSHSRPA